MPAAAASWCSAAPGAPGRLLRCGPATSLVKLHLGRRVQRVKTENNGCINLKAVGQMSCDSLKRHIPRSELLFVSETGQIPVDGQSVDEPDRSAQLEMLDKNRIDVFQKQSRGDRNLLFQNPVTEEEYIRRKYSWFPSSLLQNSFLSLISPSPFSY